MAFSQDKHERYWRARSTEVPLSASCSWRAESPLGGGFWLDHVQVYSTGFLFDACFLVLGHPFNAMEAVPGESENPTIEVVLDGSTALDSASGSLHRAGHSANDALLVSTWWVGAQPRVSLSVRVEWADWISEVADLHVGGWPRLDRQQP